jgi:uncharacterized protein
MVTMKMGRDRFAAFHSFFGNLMVINKDSMQLLDAFRKGMTIQEAASLFQLSCTDETFSRFLKAKFIVPSGTDDLDDMRSNEQLLQAKIEKGLLFKHIRFDWTHQCNFACRYCYVNSVWQNHQSPPPTFNWAAEVLDRCFELSKAAGSHFMSIRFFGGEPLLYWSPMRKVIEYAIEHKPSSLDLIFYVSTNGSLVSDEVAQFGSETGTQFIISLDGPKDVNDLMRVDLEGRGTYEEVVSGVRKLRERGNDVLIATAVGPHNMRNLRDLISEAVNLDVYHIAIDPLAYGTVRISDKTYEKIAQLILDAWEFGKGVGVELTGSWKELLERLICNPYPSFFCPAFGSKISAHPNGMVSPCSVLPINIGDINHLSNLFSSPVYRSLLQRRAGNIEMCKSCEIEGICLGGCPGEAYSTYGTIHAGNNCHFKKALVKHFFRKLESSGTEWFETL